MDDELNILPISSLINEIVPIESLEKTLENKIAKDLQDFKENIKEKPLIGPIIKIAKTLDQAKAILSFIESLTDKNFRYTVALTAAR